MNCPTCDNPYDTHRRTQRGAYLCPTSQEPVTQQQFALDHIRQIRQQLGDMQ
jgi:hypothetical protein